VVTGQDPLDYHDPTAGIGGAPPARSALPLRLVLAVFGLLTCSAGAAALIVVGAPAPGAVFAALALLAGVDAGIVIRRLGRERGRRRRG
jgi:hypothetical protein